MKKLVVILLLFTLCTFAQQGDTVTTVSGLKYIVVLKGDGPKAENNKAVEVHYTGYLPDGKVFDSSRERGEPIEFTLGTQQVIAGWDEGLALMNVGDQFRLIIPPALGYGEKGAGGGAIPPNSTLIFDVELVGMSEPKIPIGEAILEHILADTIEAAIEQYYALKQGEPDKYNFKESQLNGLGYQLMQVQRVDDAIALFKLNLESYPSSANAYDSLGEALMMKGDREEAKKNYRKSLELNPKNKNAEERLKRLEELK